MKSNKGYFIDIVNGKVETAEEHDDKVVSGLGMRVGIWFNPDFTLPRDEQTVLCIISGKFKNVSYEHAMVTGEYFDDEGLWLFDGLSAEESDLMNVDLWTYLPKNPFIDKT